MKHFTLIACLGLLANITSAASIAGNQLLLNSGFRKSRLSGRVVQELQASSFANDPNQVLVIHGDQQASQMMSAIDDSLEISVPVILLDVSLETKQAIMKRLPIQHRNEDGAALLLIDNFKAATDMTVHYRIIHVPAGNILTQVLHATVSGNNSRTAHWSTESNMLNTDAKSLESAANFEELAAEVIGTLNGYLKHCGGLRSSVADIEECWNYMTAEYPKLGKAQMIGKQQRLFESASNSMIPDKGAVWRELVETQFRYWNVKWDGQFPFKQEQAISHRLNTYWYLYIQAQPFAQIYYAFVMVDGIHNPGTQLADSNAVGLYLSNLQITLDAHKEDGTSDPERLFWIKSSPPTQNTVHEIGKSWSSTDSFSMSMNLGFEGKLFKGGLNFNYSHTFTASYSESREITDWSVVEATNPVTSSGIWNYFQSWPVDMLGNSVENFPRNWEQFYEQAWNPCRCKIVPNLSQYALTTHDTMVWGLKPELRTSDGKSLPILFSLSLKPKVTAHTCEIFDGHHKMFQTWSNFQPMSWLINVADLNNINWSG